jgi:predicted amidohydrolase
MKVALVQIPCKLGDKLENIKRMERMLDRADADVYLFSELFLTGYMCRDRLPQLAEPIDGKSVTRIQGLAEERDCDILFGMPTLSDQHTGVVHNSAVAVSPDGTVQRYDKLVPANFGPFEERLYFTPGLAPVLFDLGGMRCGVCICYDLFFPEFMRSYALEGADLLVCISASPATSREQFERILPARAAENTCYMAYANQVGAQLNMVFFGGGQAYAPGGGLLARNKYYAEDINVIDVDLREVALARRMRPTLRDTLACAGPEDQEYGKS